MDSPKSCLRLLGELAPSSWSTCTTQRHAIGRRSDFLNEYRHHSALHKSKDALVRQHALSGQDELVRRLGSDSCQEVRTPHDFHNLHNTGCNELFIVLLMKHDGKAQDRIHSTHKCGVPEHNSGHFICKLTSLILSATLIAILSFQIIKNPGFVAESNLHRDPGAAVALHRDDNARTPTRPIRYYLEHGVQLLCRWSEAWSHRKRSPQDERSI